MKRLMFALPFAFLAACAQDEAIDTTSAALTAEQCSYFADSAGKVTICHATSSTKNPFVVIRTDEDGCIAGHEDHPGDKIAIDGQCKDGCLPEGAPYGNGEYPCCEHLGLVEDGGKCIKNEEIDLCEKNQVKCEPGLCESGKCEPKTGLCIYETGNMKGTFCADADACIEKGECDGEGNCKGEARANCGCGDDAQAAGDAAFSACMAKEGAKEDACIAAAYEAFKKYYAEKQCQEEPKEWQKAAR